MSHTKSYSLNRECTDRPSLILHTSSLGGVIGFGTAFSSLIEPGTMPILSWSLFQNMMVVSVLGMALGAMLGLTLATFFTNFVVRQAIKKPIQSPEKVEIKVGELVYGT